MIILPITAIFEIVYLLCLPDTKARRPPKSANTPIIRGIQASKPYPPSTPTAPAMANITPPIISTSSPAIISIQQQPSKNLANLNKTGFTGFRARKLGLGARGEIGHESSKPSQAKPSPQASSFGSDSHTVVADGRLGRPGREQDPTLGSMEAQGIEPESTHRRGALYG